MPPSKQTLGRYQIRGGIGRGSMGVVDRAYDPVLRQEVAIKTLYGAQDLNILELFRRECSVLSGIGGHPNVMEILDIGETDGPSGRRPYFVMPLLTGVTLDEWMQTSPPAAAAAIESRVQAIVQIARGLQAAHDQGLLHRDLKPSNIFVQDDGSFKIMDFGVACLTGQRTLAGAKRTQLYTSPEQLLGKPPTAAADQFSLAVISYELLTGKHPFSLGGEDNPSERIVAQAATPCSEVNPAVSALLSRVVDKALAKEPSQRFANVREYAECLQKALRGEPIEILDGPQVDPRLACAQQAFSEGDVASAGSLVQELKSESLLNTQVRLLDKEVEGALRGQKFKQLLDAARAKLGQKEYSAALDSVQELLAKDPAHAEAVSLQKEIESAIAAGKVEAMLRAATQHCDQREYPEARAIVAKLAVLAPDDARVNLLRQEIDRESQREIERENRRREELAKQEAVAQREEAAKREEAARQAQAVQQQAEAAAKHQAEAAKQQSDAAKQAELANLEAEVRTVYQAALARVKRGDGATTLTGLASYLEKQHPETEDAAERVAAYRRLYDDLKTKCDQLQAQESSIKRLFAEEKYSAARTICQEILREYPENATFIGLLDQSEAGEKQQAAASAVGADGTPALVKPVEDITRERPPVVPNEVPEEAPAPVRPEVPEADLSPRARSRQNLIASMAVRARLLEEEGKISEAAAQWETLKAIQPEYPGIDASMARVGALVSEQTRAASKTGWLARIGQAITVQNYERAEALLQDALRAFPEDSELGALKSAVQASRESVGDVASRDGETARLVAQANTLQDQGRSDAAIHLLRSAPNPAPLRDNLTDLLLKRAEGLVDTDWFAAETLVSEAALLDPQHPVVERLKQQISDKKLARRSTAPVEKLPVRDPKPPVPEANSGGGQPESSLDEIFERTRIFAPSVAQPGTVAPPAETVRPQDAPKPKQTADALPVANVPPPKPVQEKAAPAAKMSSDATRKLTYGLLAGLAALLVLYAAISYFHSPAAAPAVKEAPVPVVMTSVPGATYRIDDASSKDVTAQATASGLVPGTYHLAASRPGFAPIDLSFTVAATEKSHPLETVWTLLPMQLIVRGPQPASLMVDEMPVAASGSGEFEKALPSGNHHVAWSSGKAASDFDVTVSEGGITQTNWMSKVPGFEAITDLQHITYDSRSLPVQIDGAKAKTPGTVDLPATGQAVKVQAGPGSLELERVDGSRFFGFMTVLLAPQAGGAKTAPRAVVKQAPKAVTPEPAKPVAPVVHVDAPPPPPPADPGPPKESTLDRLRKRAGQPDKQ